MSAVVLYGATGYAGRLTARALAAARLLDGLRALNVQIILNDRVRTDGDEGGRRDPGRELTTVAGANVAAELWFAAYGAHPRSEALTSRLSDALDATGRLRVDEHLRVVGHVIRALLAVGDITDIAQPKRAVVAEAHAKVAAAPIQALTASRELTKAYRVARVPPVLIPLGPRRGAAQLPLAGGLVAAERIVRTVKGAKLFVPRYRKLLGQP